MIVIIVLSVIILISSGVLVILYWTDSPPSSLGGFHCNINEEIVILVQVGDEISEGIATQKRILEY